MPKKKKIEETTVTVIDLDGKPEKEHGEVEFLCDPNNEGPEPVPEPTPEEARDRLEVEKKITETAQTPTTFTIEELRMEIGHLKAQNQAIIQAANKVIEYENNKRVEVAAWSELIKEARARLKALIENPNQLPLPLSTPEPLPEPAPAPEAPPENLPAVEQADLAAAAAEPGVKDDDPIPFGEPGPAENPPQEE